MPVNNPQEGWMPPAERRRLQKANGHALDDAAVDDAAVDDSAVDDTAVVDSAVDDTAVVEVGTDGAVAPDIIASDVVAMGSTYNAEQGQEICERVAAGESLQQICGVDGRPALTTVMGWLFLDEVEDFTSQYLNARSARLELMMDEVVAIADDLTAPSVQPQSQPPTKTTDDADDGGGKPSTPMAEIPIMPEKDRLAIAKLRIETRRWLIDKQLKAAPGTDTEVTGRLIPSEILHDGVGA